MKPATDDYAGSPAITRAEAIALAPVIFGDDRWRQIMDLRRRLEEMDRQADLDRQRADLYSQLSKTYQAYSPDWRALNLIAADQEDSV